MLHWGVQCENRKKTPQHKSTYTINTWLATGGHIQLWQAAVRSSSHLLRRRSQTHLTKPGGTKPEALGQGRGVMSVIGAGTREVPLQRSSQGCYPAWPWPRQAGAGEPEKKRLICFVFGANSCIPSQLFSLSILVSERINFHLQSRELHRDRIHIPVNSLSLNADRSSHSFNQNGQPCETLDSCSRLLNFSITQGKA